MKPNPPIPGHDLKWEGDTRSIYIRDETTPYDVDGGCRCGAKPDGFPHVTINAMKRWHRQHKEELRRQAGQ